MNRASWLVAGLGAGILAGLMVGRAFTPAPDVARASTETSAAAAFAPTPLPAIIQPEARAQGTAPNAADATAPAGTTADDLRLLGTMTGQPGEQVALIENARTQWQDFYSVGDTIQPGVTLVDIAGDRVTIRRNGQLETLTLVTAPVERGPKPGRTMARAAAEASVYRVYNEMRYVGPAADAHATRPRRTPQDERHSLAVAKFQQAHGMTLATAILSAGVKPRVIGSEPAGLVLRDLGSRSVLADLGFHEGDVLLSATGVPLDRPSDLAILAEDFDGDVPMWVRVERGGTPRYLLFDFG